MNDHGRACVRSVLYCGDGTKREPGLDDIAPPDDDDSLLWVDIEGAADDDAIAEVCRRLEVPRAARRQLAEPGSTPLLGNHGEHLVIHAAAVEGDEGLRFDGTALGIVAGPNFAVTVHDKPIEFLEAIREREHGENRIGALNAESFVASLLDWHLDTYFEAVAEFERAIERLEEAILESRPHESTHELRKLRKAASGLRRRLAPHRRLFSSLARPDFRPGDDGETTEHFQRLETHFERAMGAVENARELVLGSYELFSNQIALRTNNTMSLLTFATVVIGAQSVIAGILGMNFKAPFFDTGAIGFWLAIAGMVMVVTGIVLLGRRKQWF